MDRSGGDGGRGRGSPQDPVEFREVQRNPANGGAVTTIRPGHPESMLPRRDRGIDCRRHVPAGGKKGRNVPPCLQTICPRSPQRRALRPTATLLWITQPSALSGSSRAHPHLVHRPSTAGRASIHMGDVRGGCFIPGPGAQSSRREETRRGRDGKPEGQAGGTLRDPRIEGRPSKTGPGADQQGPRRKPGRPADPRPPDRKSRKRLG